MQRGLTSKLECDILNMKGKGLKMFKKFTEKRILKKIRKIDSENSSCLKYLTLNGIKSDAAILLMRGRISEEFYRKVFIGGKLQKHWSEVNHDFIYGISE